MKIMLVGFEISNKKTYNYDKCVKIHALDQITYEAQVKVFTIYKKMLFYFASKIFVKVPLILYDLKIFNILIQQFVMK